VTELLSFADARSGTPSAATLKYNREVAPILWCVGGITGELSLKGDGTS